MSMLSSQCERLRDRADELRMLASGMDAPYIVPSTKETMALSMHSAASAMREAAYTIEGLRDRLQESYGQVPELGERENEGEQESYDAGFENGVKACLQQLDGLIHEGADVEEIQGWIDRQWEDEVE